MCSNLISSDANGNMSFVFNINKVICWCTHVATAYNACMLIRLTTEPTSSIIHHLFAQSVRMLESCFLFRFSHCFSVMSLSIANIWWRWRKRNCRNWTQHPSKMTPSKWNDNEMLYDQNWRKIKWSTCFRTIFIWDAALVRDKHTTANIFIYIQLTSLVDVKLLKRKEQFLNVFEEKKKRKREIFKTK